MSVTNSSVYQQKGNNTETSSCPLDGVHGQCSIINGDKDVGSITCSAYYCFQQIERAGMQMMNLFIRLSFATCFYIDVLQLQKTFQRFCTSVKEEYKSEIDEILQRYDYNQKRKQALVGTVVSTKCIKSLVVRIVHKKYVPKYNSYVNVQKRIMAHDENGMGKLGDLVRIVPSRPHSRKKRHEIIDVVRRPKTAMTSDGVELTSAGNVKKLNSKLNLGR
jgi:small subunit ribosomal protein S17